MEAEDGGFGGANGAMDIRFKTLQLALERTRGEVTSKKETTQKIFWGCISSELLSRWRAHCCARRSIRSQRMANTRPGPEHPCEHVLEAFAVSRTHGTCLVTHSS